uniref:Uncharacterized protein n=1 Tax=Rhizophora mucronata TaxID=61149 RepID=A0A2P2MIG3_RHIMU
MVVIEDEEVRERRNADNIPSPWWRWRWRGR